jgi:hypothetical protein
MEMIPLSWPPYKELWTIQQLRLALKGNTFWNMMLYSLVEFTHITDKRIAFIFRVESDK